MLSRRAHNPHTQSHASRHHGQPRYRFASSGLLYLISAIPCPRHNTLSRAQCGSQGRLIPHSSPSSLLRLYPVNESNALQSWNTPLHKHIIQHMSATQKPSTIISLSSNLHSSHSRLQRCQHVKHLPKTEPHEWQHDLTIARGSSLSFTSS